MSGCLLLIVHQRDLTLDLLSVLPSVRSLTNSFIRS